MAPPPSPSPSPSGPLVIASPQDSMANEEPSTSEEQEQEGWRWDCSSNLFYHASTGFYHDPGAAWYYNTRDGLYYDEAFNLLPPPATAQSPAQEQEQEQEQEEEEEEEEDSESDNAPYPPPSQWLDELLINQYLSGYRNAPAHVGEGECQIDDEPSEEMLATSTLDGQENNTTPQNESGTERMLSAEEENWMAQYGQVDRSHTDEGIIKAIDLWDWELVKETSHKGNSRRITRLMGQLVGQTTSMHPSLPSSGGTLKTTAIRQVHLDLVLVASGKMYRLRTPRKRYLATLSEYDSSNPTKDWGFPLLSPDSFSLLSPPTTDFNPSSSIDYAMNSQKQGTNESRYRDRAAERRRLHGANSIAPCQKDGNSEMRWTCDDDPTIAQEEARMLSFGSNSYGSKIMQSMGWKQGEALGSSAKGILEPVEPKGNTGTSGLGWQRKSTTSVLFKDESYSWV